jgi:hypothetical protein
MEPFLRASNGQTEVLGLELRTELIVHRQGQFGIASESNGRLGNILRSLQASERDMLLFCAT